MGKKYLNEFLMTLNKTFINGYERVRDDLEWFICKNDYRYKEQPWKNARDALQRGLVKAGSIMEAEEKKEQVEVIKEKGIEEDVRATGK